MRGIFCPKMKGYQSSSLPTQRYETSFRSSSPMTTAPLLGIQISVIAEN